MSLSRYKATRFEAILHEGRTHPVVLACKSDQPNESAVPMVVKAIGCPEINMEWQLVTEVVGNATARRCGIATPEPAIVEITPAVAKAINQSNEIKSTGFAVHPGFASGCAYIKMEPYTIGQMLGPAARGQAEKIFLFDLLAQNADRRPEKVNCGINADGLVAFDFELCFAHKYLPIIGGAPSPWEPSKTPDLSRNHLFRSIVEKNPPTRQSISEMISKLTLPWWETIARSLPLEWQWEAGKIGDDLMAVANHAEDFYKDIVNRCLK